MTNKFYHTTPWRKKRPSILKRDKYCCRECKRYGKRKDAQMVHHIIPLGWCLIFNKALALSSENLISLCNKCHEKMHDRINDKLTPVGLDWVRRIGPKGIDWITKYSDKAW